jgi:hypothetical protein
LIKRYKDRPPATIADISSALFEVQSRIHDEMSVQLYIQVPAQSAKYYEPDEPPFGDIVFDRFSSASGDVIEAGNCLALERYTACVFHLMRVMEVGLKALASKLGITYAPSWEAYIKQIKTILESDWKAKPLDLQTAQPLYRDLVGDLHLVKVAWRNPTMHIVNNYGKDEAVKIYDCVRQFMVRLSEGGLHDTFYVP